MSEKSKPQRAAHKKRDELVKNIKKKHIEKGRMETRRQFLKKH